LVKVCVDNGLKKYDIKSGKRPINKGKTRVKSLFVNGSKSIHYDVVQE